MSKAGKKKRIGIIFGGKSAEHEISILSAENIIKALDDKKYEPVLIGIDKDGEWHSMKLKVESEKLKVYDGLSLCLRNKKIKNIFSFSGSLDVVFPVLHGPFGEDGSMQGLLKMVGVPFVGSGVLGSVAAMDKDVAKRLMRDAGIPTADFLSFGMNDRINFNEMEKRFGLPIFVKPANLGSSVGISRAENNKEFESAIKKAFRYDNKIIVEKFIDGREIECAVLGNENPVVSILGEVIPRHKFYSYEAKYIDKKGAILKIPAELSNEMAKEAQSLAIKTFQILGCEGMARVDFFLKKDGELLVNEVNTIPGFTKISMYPKLWEESGVSSTALVDKLINLALERFKKERKLKTSV